MHREFVNGASTYSLMVLSPSGRGVARLTSPTGLLGVVAIVVIVVIVVSVDDGDSRLLEFASLGDVSTFCGRRRDGLLRKELDNGVRGIVSGATRSVGDPGTDCDVADGGGGGGTDGIDVTCTSGNRGGGNGRL